MRSFIPRRRTRPQRQTSAWQWPTNPAFVLAGSRPNWHGTIVDVRAGSGRQAGSGARDSQGHDAGRTVGAKSPIHKLVLAFVWLTVVSGAVVFSEPAPVDVLTIGMIILLPLVGLVRISWPLLMFLGFWLIIAAAAFVSAANSPDIGPATIHSTVSLYLYFAAFTFAVFVARNPLAHTRLIMNGYLWAASIAALAGIIGYFGVIPGTQEILTKFGRASGTFKDPNVFGAFLAPAAVYAIHLVLTRPFLRASIAAAVGLLLAAAILLSFSRGAWMSLAVSGLVWGYLSFITANTNRHRVKMIILSLIGVLSITGIMAAALQVDAVSDLFQVRASLDQSYDYGPDGRFGGQAKAAGIILENPLGIGALTFTKYHHAEDVHNVFLSMFLNAGWVGGFLFFLAVAATLAFGLRHGFRRTATQPIFLVVYAAFIGVVVESLIVDTDHWRHFYLLMGIIWGIMTVDRKSAAQLKPAQRGRRPAKIIGPRRLSHRPPRRLIRARKQVSRPIRRRHRPHARPRKRSTLIGRRQN